MDNKLENSELTGAQDLEALGADVATLIGDATGAGTTADLSNDHPVSVTYNDSNASLYAKTTALATIGGGTWTTPGATSNIEDILKGVGGTTVECATCHDPHVSNPTFLRYSLGNAKSALCLACHNK